MLRRTHAHTRTHAIEHAYLLFFLLPFGKCLSPLSDVISSCSISFSSNSHFSTPGWLYVLPLQEVEDACPFWILWTVCNFQFSTGQLDFRPTLFTNNVAHKTLSIIIISLYLSCCVIDNNNFSLFLLLFYPPLLHLFSFACFLLSLVTSHFYLSQLLQ